MRMPASPLGDGVLDGLDLGVLVAVLLAGGDGDVDAEVVGGGLGAVLHGDEERVGVGLRDERDATVSSPPAASVVAGGADEAHPVKASAVLRPASPRR